MESAAVVEALTLLLNGSESSAVDLESLRTIQTFLQSPSSPNFTLELDTVDDLVEHKAAHHCISFSHLSIVFVQLLCLGMFSFILSSCKLVW